MLKLNIDQVFNTISAEMSVTDRRNCLQCTTTEAMECLKSWAKGDLVTFEKASKISTILQNCKQEAQVSRIVN